MPHKGTAVTMADVGTRAGVTARTVSNVLSGSSAVRPETRDRVLRAVDELGYRLNSSASSLKTGRTGRITLAIPDLRIDYFADFAQRAMLNAQKHDWSVMIEETGARRDKEIAILSGARGQHSDGLIFAVHALGRGDERYFRGNDRLVILGDRIFNGPVDHVTVPNVDGARMATQYLIDRGHRKIAVIGANPHVATVSTASLRLDTFLETMAANQIPVPDEYVVVAEEWHLHDGSVGMLQLLSLPEPPDAVFCFNDTLALGALHAAALRGIRVPEQVAIMGFDNVRMSEYAVPSLTTIDPGADQVARLAVDLLAARFEGRSGPPVDLVSTASLVVRRSA